jgi:hypothetical protein
LEQTKLLKDLLYEDYAGQEDQAMRGLPLEVLLAVRLFNNLKLFLSVPNWPEQIPVDLLQPKPTGLSGRPDLLRKILVPSYRGFFYPRMPLGPTFYSDGSVFYFRSELKPPSTKTSRRMRVHQTRLGSIPSNFILRKMAPPTLLIIVTQNSVIRFFPTCLRLPYKLGGKCQKVTQMGLGLLVSVGRKGFPEES